MKIIESIRNYIGNLDCMKTFENAINTNFLDGEVNSFSIEEIIVGITTYVTLFSSTVFAKSNLGNISGRKAFLKK